ncbi:hypothetical protein GALMADRAFT_52973 [Galerina marginata CBS 339.88]|uniref:Ceramide glucosyltransferase n=1 Tax=Galerina marginata (strain CBS 339.88) TaxID=685588 RepID=A0A067TZA9_GALM3|nr:hypothetical protein GALMADRAFT_52973 [Galerina marginata CBS 339.88]
MNQDALVHGIAAVAFVWYLALWLISILGCVAARRRYRSRDVYTLSRAETSNSPGVSILRPLKGLDTNLYENLESSFKQEYSNYEIIFSVADENDQALPIVQALVSRYPRVKVTVIIGMSEIVGVNPKVNNLVRAFRAAAHDIVWVIDSGVIVDSGTLARSVEVLTRYSLSSPNKKVALVHHVPFALMDETRVGSRLEAAFLNTNHAKMYIAINTVGIESCVVGKSNLYRRSDIERLNGSLIPIQSQSVGTYEPGKYGLPTFGRFLAEDNMIAGALWHELGLRHDLSCDVARNVVGNMSFLDYVWRRVRWIRVRKRMVLAATLVEPFTESIMLCVIGNFGCKHLFSASSWIFIPSHFILWLSVDLDVYTSIAGHTIQRDETASFLFAWIGRELLAFPIWVLAFFGNDVIWRGKRYQILKSGEARLCTT